MGLYTQIIRCNTQMHSVQSTSYLIVKASFVKHALYKMLLGKMEWSEFRWSVAHTPLRSLVNLEFSIDIITGQPLVSGLLLQQF